MGLSLGLFCNSLNKEVIDSYKYIANTLNFYKVPLDNVFFVSTPSFLIFYTNTNKEIILKTASDYCDFLTRKVIFEKCKIDKKFKCYFHRQPTKKDKMESKPLNPFGSKAFSSLSDRLDYNKSIYGEYFDSM